MRKENDAWHIQGNWFLKYFWGRNFLFLLLNSIFEQKLIEPIDCDYPKNSFSLILGSVAGLIFTPVYIAIVIIIVAFIIALVIFGALILLFEKAIVPITNRAFKRIGKLEFVIVMKKKLFIPVVIDIDISKKEE